MANAPDRRLLLGLAAGAFTLQLIPDLFGGYGYFIDELYYIACARRLDWGYVDHPPLAPFLLRAAMTAWGDSVAAIRLLPALAGAAAAYCAGWLAAFFGGGRWAQALAAVTVTLGPIFLVFFDIFSMNGFEILFWTAGIAIVLVMVRKNEPKLWLAFGAVSGLGLLNKHTMVLLGVAVVAGLALTPARRLLWSRWLWLGGLVAFVLCLPNLGWQVANDWPSLEFYRNATLEKNLPSPPLKTLWNQFLFMNPILFPVWGAGLVFLCRDPRHRVAAFAYVILLSILVVSQSSRPDRIAPIYPVLLAAGAAWWEGVLARYRQPVRWAFFGVVLAGGLAFLPMFQPVLPPASLARFVAFVGIDTQIERGEGKRAELPQWMADRFGWENLVAQVSDVYDTLPPEDKRRALILAPSYGHAGAFELWRDRLGGAPVLSPHNTYHLWGRELAPRLAEATVIAVGFDAGDLEMSFGDVRQAGVYECNYCMNWRNDMAIHVARQPRLNAAQFAEAWERIRHFE